MAIADYLGSQEEAEIAIGLIAPLGTDLPSVIRRIEWSLENQYKRPTQIWRLSESIADHDLARLGIALHEEPEHERLYSHMDAGDALRRDAGARDYVAAYTIGRIANWRKETTGFAEQPVERHIHILNSLKHPDEVELLRRMYGPGFFLIGISASSRPW